LSQRSSGIDVIELARKYDQEENTMRSSKTAYLAATLMIGVGILLLIGPIGIAPAQGSETAVLRLKVCTCAGSWLSGAEVEASIHRPGEGQVDLASGYTDNDGYICLRFDDLVDHDEAHVTVTPAGGSPDPNHRYEWISEEGEGDTPHWDILPDLQRGCSDDWFEGTKKIIRCKVSS
jgi:hypothetical protein